MAIIGAGGIGFRHGHSSSSDHGPSTSLDRDRFLEDRGGWIDDYRLPGGLLADFPASERSSRRVTLLQRKAAKMGASLGKTTGWIHRATLEKIRGVAMLNGVVYEKIDEDGLHIVQKRHPADDRAARYHRCLCRPGAAANTGR